MRKRWNAALAGLITLWTAVPAMACLGGGWAGPYPSVEKDATVVVVGRVSQYEIVMSPGGVEDYARFRITVDKVLKGQPPHVMTATWSGAINNGFARPENINDGPYLIALRDPELETDVQDRSQLFGFMRSPEAGARPVLQGSCETAVFLDATSDGAMAVRRWFQKPAQ